MALAFTLVDSGTNSADQSAYASSSNWTPTDGRIYFAFVSADRNSATPTGPSMIGNGQTWDSVTSALFSTNQGRIAAFRCKAASSSVGTVAFDFAGDVQVNMMYSIVEVTGADTTGTNGVNAVRQIKTGANRSTGTVQVDYDSATLAGNGSLGYMTRDTTSAGAVTEPAGWTSLAGQSVTPTGLAGRTAYIVGQADSSIWSITNTVFQSAVLQIEVAVSGSVIAPSGSNKLHTVSKLLIGKVG